MLRELLSSRPARGIGSGHLAGSVFAHAGLIAIVILTTPGASPNSHGWQSPRESTPVVHLQYLTLTPADVSAPGKALNGSEKRTTPARRSSVSERHGARSRLASLKESLGAITDRLAEIRPAIDAADVVHNHDIDDSRWTAVADSEFSKGPSRLSDAVPTPVAQVKNGVYTPDLVDEQVAPRPGNPKPRYPESLRAAGVEGDVNVQFVVDTTGRVDEPTIKFSSHIHELFMDAIRVSLRKARFFPARLAGATVPQLVQQEFRFELRERP